MTEPAIGFADHARKIAIGNAPADKGTDHVDRDFGVRLAGETLRSPRGRAPAKDSGTYKSAIAGETREHHLDKIKRGGLAPC